MVNFKFVFDSCLCLAGVICAMVSLGYSLFSRNISLTSVGIYLLVLAILLGLQKLIRRRGQSFRGRFVFFLWTMTAIQIPLNFTISETFPLWQMGVLLASMAGYALSELSKWRRDFYANMLTACFRLFITTVAYFTSVVTLMDGVWDISSDLAAMSVVIWVYCVHTSSKHHSNI